MSFIIRILANSLAIYLIAYLIKGVDFDGGWKMLLLAGFVLSLINIVIKPIVKFISLPLIILTFGVFSLVINILMLWLLTKIIPDLSISGIMAFIWSTIIVSAVNIIINWLAKKPSSNNNIH
ncbi:MAG: phage holin family protein [Candidatus Portnoybacteria bacterium]|nr:phage holin family protein [Candidatus Portnoybacteria bacterium]